MSVNYDELKIQTDLELMEIRGKKKEFCLEDKCDKLASYNYQTNSHKYYCVDHKLKNMINLWECRNCSLRINFKNKFNKKK